MDAGVLKECPLLTADSTGRRNVLVKVLGKSRKVKCFKWSLIQQPRYFVELVLRVVSVIYTNMQYSHTVLELLLTEGFQANGSRINLAGEH